MFSHLSERYREVQLFFSSLFFLCVCVCVLLFIFLVISQFLSNHRSPFSQGWCMQGFLCKHPPAYCSIFLKFISVETPTKCPMRQQLDCYGRTSPREPGDDYEARVLLFICCTLLLPLALLVFADFCTYLTLCVMSNSSK